MSGALVVGLGRLGRLGGRVLGLSVAVAVWLLVVGGGCAWATAGHTFAGEFGGPGDGDGQFDSPAGVGVLASTGEVFAAGQYQYRVQRFSADGVFASQFGLDRLYQGGVSGLAVDGRGAGAVYVATGFNGGVPSVVKYGLSGGLAYALSVGGSTMVINGGARVAVDPVDGVVYVNATDTATGLQVIARFDGSTGVFIDSFDGSVSSPDGGFGTCAPPADFAVDGSQRVYVLDSCKGRVDRFSSSGVWQATLDPQLPLRGDGIPETLSAVAADPVSDEVYVAHTGPVGMQVTQFSAGGAGVVYTFDASSAGGVRAMAVSGAGTVYTADSTRPFVQRFTRFEGPTVVTGGSSSVQQRSAVLEGTINPEGVASTYHFEYGTDNLTFGSQTAESAPVNGSVTVAATTLADGLQPNKTYYYRLVGSNGSGSIVGGSGSFTTLPAPSDVGGSFVSAIRPRSARLHGTVNPNNAPAFSFTSLSMEYGTTTAYGTTLTGLGPASNFGNLCGVLSACGGEPQPVFVDVSGLEPGQTYHFRYMSNNGQGATQGPDQTFVTAPAAGGGATGVTAGRASLTGTINPHGVATSYHFNYGLTSSYGASTPEVAGGSSDGDRAVSTAVSGLLSDTTYHVQVVATSTDGTVRSGGDGVFRTAPAPTAQAIGPTGVSTDAATLVGDVNTFGSTGSYHFDVWSLDSSYVRSTPERAVAGNASAERVSAALAGLPAGQTFVVQLSVSSNDAVGVSDLQTFATAEVPKVFPPPPASDGVSLYGCGSPRLNAYSARPKPGEMITVSGQDLGVGGGVMLGDRSLEPVGWSATGFRVVVPEDASGTLALTVNCGRRSNTIAVAIFQEPDNRFAVTGRSVAGSTATLRVRVPGPGKLETFGANTTAAKVTIKKPGAASIKIKLTNAGTRALSRAASRTRRVAVRVRFTPAGGRSASKTVTITYKRKASR